jgi:hypothetical protein
VAVVQRAHDDVQFFVEPAVVAALDELIGVIPGHPIKAGAEFFSLRR